tara:strand:- start:511 stop:939 length:429 start_codon:yes stop_codon:yes gene_type:complete
MKLPPNPLIYEILAAAGKARLKADKIKVLKDHDSWALRDVLRATYDLKVEFLIPDGEPPYTPNAPESIPSNLLRKNVDFKYIVKGGIREEMPAFKREKIYIGLLESIHPEDAKVVINMVNRKRPAPGITENIVKEAFPSLFK